MVTSRQKARRADRHILVVDDNPAVLRLLGTLFEEEGMTVRLAQSAKEARAWLAAAGEVFDLVLSDISMPVETGFDLLQWIKRDGSPYASLPVLLTTAQLPEAANRLKGLAMGAVDYVVRPIELRELALRTINAIDHFQRVKALETTLQDSENLAMVGRVMAASNHEIRNLSTIVKVCADQLQKCFGAAAGKEAQAVTALKALKEASELLTDVARNVASLLDPASIVLKPVDLVELAQQISLLMHTRIRPCRVDTLTDGDRPCWATGHDVRLKQVLINLLLNAADAISELDPAEGGRIAIRVGGDDDRVWISVTDNGIGLSRAGERTEFTAFATTKKLRGGQGLGLWLCARLINGMGGTLSLSSAGVGKGATATITLPGSAAPDTQDFDLDVQKYLDELDGEG